MTWENKPVTDAEYRYLAKKAVFTSLGWFLSPTEVIGYLECGSSKALRYKAVVLARLGRDFPNGPANGSRITDKDLEDLRNEHKEAVAIVAS